MILHCTPPYQHEIPNAPLGYLKGFLEAKGVPVQNVYWNLVLAEKLSKFYTIFGDYSRNYVTSIIFHVCRHLLNRDSDPEDSNQTPFDLFFSSAFSKEEMSEMTASLKDNIDQYILQNNLHETNLSGFTLKTYQWMMDYYIINRLKEMNPESNVVIGGTFNENQARAFMRIFNQANFAIWGEGEYPLYSLSKTLEEGTALAHVPQLAYRDDGKILVTRARGEQCHDLDSYPFADHTDYFRAKKKFTPFDKSTMIPIWGSRACSWNKCKFCVINEEYAYRSRSPENVVEELEFQSKKHNVHTFFFVDSDVAGNKKRFIKLLTLLIQSIRERRRPYRLYTEISPIFIDAETAPYIRRAGFIRMQIGFEAVTDGLLQKMQKRHGFVHNIQALKLGIQHNLPLAGLNVIRGILTETRKDALESRSNLKLLRFFLRRYNLEPTILMLYKGSPFYDETPEDEREEWIEDPFWEEAAPLNLIPESERFEFFGFCRDKFTHHQLWESFENLLNFYSQLEFSYEWTESPDGSLVEEKSVVPRKYTLDRDETDILVFCDSIRRFSEVKKEFHHISEENLFRIMKKLKDYGFLYYDENERILSV